MDYKGNKKDKKPHDQNGDLIKSNEESSKSKKKNSQKKKVKGEMRKCAYYGKGFHPERSCMKKKNDMLNQILEKTQHLSS